MKKLLFSFLALLFIGQSVHAQTGWTKTYDNGLVVTAEVYASQAGKQILEQGGNAVDAAVAVQFALAVTLPRAGNIGGGGFMVIRLNDGTTNALDFREVGPLASTRNMFIRNGEFNPELSQLGILASGVPGVVDGMVTAHKRYGRLSWEAVLQPAIELASEGYYLSYMQARELNGAAKKLSLFEGSRKYFMKENGEPFKEGELFVQKDLANTLEQIMRFGRDGFYSGPVADAIVKEMETQGGIITHQDLHNYRSKWRTPITVNFKGYELTIMPPPSSGSIAVAQILSMMEDYDLKAMGHNSADYVHLLAESMRRAFADRSFYLGDPDFWEVPQDVLISKAYNKDRMKSFSMDKVTPSTSLEHGDTKGYKEPDQTTHFSIVDKDGNAVGVTTTINGSFGSHLAVNGAGFLLNNEMDDFSAQPGEPNMFGLIGGEANAIQSGKRMLSSMTPTIVAKDGKPRMILGAAGGPRIITATLQTFLNGAVFGMNAQRAVSAARIHHQWFPDVLRFDPYGLSPDTQKLLIEKGYELVPTVLARTHNIFIDENGRKSSGVDTRGDGYGAGY
ncbi:MAG: gamma-glutamyltransferase [Balneolaceae bacterium]